MKKSHQILALCVVAVVGFYVGMQFGGSSSSGSDFANMSSEERQARFAQMRDSGATGARSMGNRAKGVGFINGEVINKDENSITVKLDDGGSKLLFISAETKILTELEISFDKLEIGQQVMANGAANDDGSVNADSVRVR